MKYERSATTGNCADQSTKTQVTGYACSTGQFDAKKATLKGNPQTAPVRWQVLTAFSRRLLDQAREGKRAPL
ncbi:hypothetical protein IAQ61_009775 [Plenodomus lingam]|uniref:uncharacterized protein n=1 Tax=Leptosphaeria maculans TaxID=5022 RepID=UPI003323B93E|nr:hypothetical protein IAQ61_009775 [Plenodomus lingam]